MRKLLFLDMDGVIAHLPEGSKHLWDGPEFWANLEKTPGADDLVRVCMAHYDVHILSSPIAGPASAMGKMLWLGLHYPDLVCGAIFTEAKCLLAGPDRILVDDDPQNCWEFYAEGGAAIRVPNAERFPGDVLTCLTIPEILIELESGGIGVRGCSHFPEGIRVNLLSRPHVGIG